LETLYGGGYRRGGELESSTCAEKGILVIRKNESRWTGKWIGATLIKFFKENPHNKGCGGGHLGDNIKGSRLSEPQTTIPGFDLGGIVKS